MGSRALVIGNGESRRCLSLDSFHDYTLIGCNAIHRDLPVHHLVCCDQRMVKEAVDNPSTSNTTIYVRDIWYHYFRKIRKNKNISLLPELPYQGDKRHDKPIHWNSGPYAILLAALLEHREISLIGFDLYSANDKVNNIYKGTANYSNPNSSPVDPAYWKYQIGKIFDYFPEIEFVVYNHSTWIMPQEWRKQNVQFQSIILDYDVNIPYNNTIVA